MKIKIGIVCILFQLFLMGCYDEEKNQPHRNYVSSEVLENFLKTLKTVQESVGEGNHKNGIAICQNTIFYSEEGFFSRNGLRSVMLRSDGGFVLRYTDDYHNTEVEIKYIPEKEDSLRLDKKIEFKGLPRDENIERLLEDQTKELNYFLK